MSLDAPIAPPAHSSRPAMLAGFAVVFGLWIISGEELLRNNTDVNRQVEATAPPFSAARTRSQPFTRAS